MAQRYGFFNSVNNDRVYDASDVARFLKKFFTNGVFNNTLQVSSNDNMTVTVSSGNANIEGYGYAIANDVGSAIKGKKVDLYMEKYEQCLMWGARSVNVYVVDEA